MPIQFFFFFICYNITGNGQESRSNRRAGEPDSLKAVADWIGTLGWTAGDQDGNQKSQQNKLVHYNGSGSNGTRWS
jgi:hypothetical protein